MRKDAYNYLSIIITTSKPKLGKHKKVKTNEYCIKKQKKKHLEKKLFLKYGKGDEKRNDYF